MTEQMSVVKNDALKLPTLERVKRAEVLLASLDKPGTEIDPLWGKEADRRVEAYDNGELRAVPAAEVFGKHAGSGFPTS